MRGQQEINPKSYEDKCIKCSSLKISRFDLSFTTKNSACINCIQFFTHTYIPILAINIKILLEILRILKPPKVFNLLKEVVCVYL